MDKDRVGEIVSGCIAPIFGGALLIVGVPGAIWIWGFPAVIVIILLYLVFILVQLSSQLGKVSDELHSIRTNQIRIEESIDFRLKELAEELRYGHGLEDRSEKDKSSPKRQSCTSDPNRLPG